MSVSTYFPHPNSVKVTHRQEAPRMVDALSAIPPGVGAFGLAFAMLGGLWTLVATGLMVPRRHHKDRIADKDEQIVLLRDAVKVKDDQIDKLTVANDAWVRTMSAVEKLAATKGGGA